MLGSRGMEVLEWGKSDQSRTVSMNFVKELYGPNMESKFILKKSAFLPPCWEGENGKNHSPKWLQLLGSSEHPE